MSSHLTRLRVRYAETDQMGVVYYANYLVWMEVARVEYCKALGFSYEQMEREDGIFLAVADEEAAGPRITEATERVFSLIDHRDIPPFITEVKRDC